MRQGVALAGLHGQSTATGISKISSLAWAEVTCSPPGPAFICKQHDCSLVSFSEVVQSPLTIDLSSFFLLKGSFLLAI